MSSAVFDLEGVGEGRGASIDSDPPAGASCLPVDPVEALSGVFVFRAPCGGRRSNSGPGPYVVRVKVPPGVQLMPHKHSADRVYTAGSRVRRHVEERNRMAKMRVVQISRAGGPLEIVERDIPSPGPGHVRVRVEANGICHSDVLTKDGLMPGIQYP